MGLLGRLTSAGGRRQRRGSPVPSVAPMKPSGGLMSRGIGMAEKAVESKLTGRNKVKTAASSSAALTD